jgi:hypothetical protein
MALNNEPADLFQEFVVLGLEEDTTFGREMKISGDNDIVVLDVTEVGSAVLMPDVNVDILTEHGIGAHFQEEYLGVVKGFGISGDSDLLFDESGPLNGFEVAGGGSLVLSVEFGDLMGLDFGWAFDFDEGDCVNVVLVEELSLFKIFFGHQGVFIVGFDEDTSLVREDILN